MVLSSTIIIVSKMIEYGQEMPIALTAGQSGTVRKGHNVGIVQAVTVQYRYISSHFLIKVNKLCSDNTMICQDIGPALLVSKL